MKILSVLFMIVAAMGLIIGAIWRLIEKPFPIADIPPQSWLEFSAICLLFALTLCVYSIAKKSP